MMNFRDWLASGSLDEGIMDSLGRSRLVRGAVAAAGIASAGLPGVGASEPAAVADSEDEGSRRLLERGPDNWMVADPARAPEWYKPHLADWYRRQIKVVSMAKIRRIEYEVKDDPRWLQRLIDGGTGEVASHTVLVSPYGGGYTEMTIAEPLKNPLELVSRVSYKYRDRLILFYKSKLAEID